MTIRPALLLASAAALGVSSPALAQDYSQSSRVDDRYCEQNCEYRADHHGQRHAEHHAERHAAHHGGDPVMQDGAYEGEWEGSWTDEDHWQGEWTGTYTDAEGRTVNADYSGVWMGDAHFMSEDGRVLSHDGRGHWREHRRSNAHAAGLGYTTEQRNRWLAECRYLMAGGGGYYDERYDDGRNGSLIGGVIGAVGGGIIGNRIAGSGDRLLGTVIGAGVGGIAGAAIGDAVDGSGDEYGDLDREELWAARYCEAYLARHEMGAGYGYGQAVMMVPVRTRSRRGCGSCSSEVIVEEEIIEVERPARRVVPPRPQGGKRQRVN